MTTPPHGTTRRYQAGCRQECCKAANRAHTNKRRQGIATGTWKPFVDAEPVRRHVATLRAAGMSLRQIAELAGANLRQLDNLIYGDPADGQPPQNRIRPATAQRILAVSPVPRRLPSRGYVDGTGTRRRLRALAAIGWTSRELAQRAGCSLDALARLKSNESGQTHVSIARAVRALFAELWNQSGPSTKARAHAARRGWLPPLAWDDGTIDNPAARPAQRRRRRDRPAPRSRPAVALLEDSEELLRQGVPFDLVAKRLAVKPDSLHTARSRARVRARAAQHAAEGSR